MTTTYVPRQREWSLVELFEGITAADVTCSKQDLRAAEPRLWIDLAAEWDARLLEAHILGADREFSPEFYAFLKGWAADEERHTEGLLRLYSLVTGEPEDAVLSRLRARAGDFSSVEPLLAGEFEVLILLAYDEAMSTAAYRDDIPFYRSLGPASFGRLLRELKNDEAMHYRNAVELLVLAHSDRVDDVPGEVERVVQFDKAQEEYRATFVLDHATDQFDGAEMERVGRSVVRAIQRRMRGQLDR
jgi:hypothetical protein